MKKTHFFSVSKLPFLFMLFSMMMLISCGGSGKKHHADNDDGDLEDEEEVIGIEDGADEDAAQFTNDFNGELGRFELRGPVMKISTISEASPSCEEVYYFDREGFLAEENGQRLANNEWSKYTRDDKGRIIKEELGNGGVENYEYNEKGQMVKHHYERGSQVETDWYTYNNNGDRTERKNDYVEMGEEGSLTTTYEILSRDSHGNWTKRRLKQDRSEDVENRTITYYE